MKRTKLQAMVRQAVLPSSTGLESVDVLFEQVAADFDTVSNRCFALESHLEFLDTTAYFTQSEYRSRIADISELLLQTNPDVPALSCESYSVVSVEDLKDHLKNAWKKTVEYLKELFNKLMSMFQGEKASVTKTIARLETIKPKVTPQICQVKIVPVTAEEKAAIQEEVASKAQTKQAPLALPAPQAPKPKATVTDHDAVQSIDSWAGLAISKFGAIPASDDTITLSTNVPRDLNEQIDSLFNLADFKKVESLQNDVFDVAKQHPDVDDEGLAGNKYQHALRSFKLFIWQSLIQNFSIEDNVDDDADVFNVVLIGDTRLFVSQNRKHYSESPANNFTTESFITLRKAKRDVTNPKPISLKDLGIHKEADLNKILHSLQKLEELQKEVIAHTHKEKDKLFDLEGFDVKHTTTVKVQTKVWKTTVNWMRFIRYVSAASLSTVHSVSDIATAAVKTV